MRAVGQSYELGELLSDLGWARLWRAVRLSDQRSILLKVLESEHSGSHEVERLRNECDIGKELGGPWVLETLGLGMFQGRPSLELAAFEGRSLDERVSVPAPAEDFLPLAISLARAIADIHAQGLIHRDLKPGNVLFDPPSGDLRICGFGLALRARLEQAAPPLSSTIEGSLPYMSPEQTGQMNRAVDGRSDLYSLGVVLYQLLTARLPFEARDALGWVHCHVARKPVPPNQITPSVPDALSAMVLKLLAKMPEDRYQTAAGLVHDLELSERQWREYRVVASFPLGQNDISDRFRVPQKLYGREPERAALRAALDRVSTTGAPELVLVSGYAGVGKSAVIRDLKQPVLAMGGRFVEGKFEKHKAEIPYFPIAEAFGEVAFDIVAQGEREVARYRDRLGRELGHRASAIVDVIPQMALVLRPRPHSTSTPSSHEAEARLRIAFQGLFCAFAGAEHALVVFLDDLQWADPASLKLVVDLMTDEALRHVLLVGTYRDNEVEPSHPLAQAIAKIRGSGALVRDLALRPLSENDVGQLVAETLHRPREETDSLARLVSEKTGANPFFVIQFLTSLHRGGLIEFDRRSSQWRWDTARIRAETYTDNVVDLMLAKLRRLPTHAQQALQMTACLGATVERATLAAVFGHDPEAELRPALEEDLLLRLDGAYRFPHDRVQEAAYSLIEPERRAEIHLEVGRRLLSHTRTEALDEKVFEIATQLDRGAALICSLDERERVAELNLRAGRRAKAAAAYASGAAYLAAGMALLDESSWSRRYDLAFGTWLERASCELLSGQFEVAERLIAELFPRCASKMDACEVYRAKILLHERRSQPGQAVETALTCLRLLGIDMPAHPTWDEVQAEYDAVWRAVGDRTVESLGDLPILTDPELRTALELLSHLKPPAYNFDTKLVQLLTCRMMSISVLRGVTDASADGCAFFAFLLGPIFHRYGDGARFAGLALDLVERRGLSHYRAAVFVVLGSVSTWTQPLASALALWRKGFDAALETSDLSQACYCLPTAGTVRAFRGDPLEEARREADQGANFARRVGFADMTDWLVSQRQFADAMQGRTADLAVFGDGPSEDATFESRLTENRNSVLRANYWLLKTKARYLAGDYRGALVASQEVERVQWGIMGQVVLVEHAFFAGLAAASTVETASEDERPRLRATLALQEQQLREWAEVYPPNFRDKHALVSGEIARLDGRDRDAAQAYEVAIRAARESGFVHQEALAYEVAARFYRARDFGQIADLYLREARDRYRRWGAAGKVKQLERLYPQIAEAKPLGLGATLALEAGQLDYLAVIKASQTISSVMARDELLRTLLRVVLEEASARRACLVLFREGAPGADPGEWEVLTESVSDDIAAPKRVGEVAARVPVSILEYVRRTQERVMLDDASADLGRFSGDPYFAQARPRALLCLPVRRQAAAVAALYLENDLLAAAFTRERLAALDVLAAQAAISLENSLLLEREHARRVDAEGAERRALLLGEATALMSSTVAFEEVLSALARLCSQSFADWTVIDLKVDGQIVRLAGAHRDPEKEPLLRELSQYPARAPNPITAVIEGGAPVFVPFISDEQIERSCVDARHRELAHTLGTRSSIIVPLIARGQQVGALSFVAATPNRYQPADVALAAEIGRRAGISIDNTRLLEETRRALRLREEFLAVASHELRTPMTSLQLSVQQLLRFAKGKTSVSTELLSNGLERVLSATSRLAQLTGQLVEVMSVEQGGLHLQPTRVDLEQLVRSVVGQLDRELGSARCKVSIDCTEPAVGQWDASRLGEVVAQLLSNAMKFGAGQPIEIRVGRAGGGARLQITDHGMGIDSARLAHIFERFERGVSSAHYGGLGLGLYLVRSIVLLHGGSIDVESEPGAGTTFTVVLPKTILAPGQADHPLVGRSLGRPSAAEPSACPLTAPEPEHGVR